MRGYLGTVPVHRRTGELENPPALRRRKRSRVIIAKILKRGGNVIVLDEPTNDLDLATAARAGRGAGGVWRRGGGGESRPVFPQPGVYVGAGVRGRRATLLRRGELRRLHRKRAAHKAEAARWAAEAAQLKTQAASATAATVKPAAMGRKLSYKETRELEPSRRPSARRRRKSSGWKRCWRRRIFTRTTGRAGRRRKPNSPRRSGRSRGCTRAGRSWSGCVRRPRRRVRDEGDPSLSSKARSARRHQVGMRVRGAP